MKRQGAVMKKLNLVKQLSLAALLIAFLFSIPAYAKPKKRALQQLSQAGIHGGAQNCS